jgi:AbrB family looped-hinge helix DNA binding protein
MLQSITSTITSKGQVTIPVTIRKALGVKTKDKVLFLFADGKVEIKPSRMLTLKDARGAIPPLKPFRSLKQVRESAIDEHVEQVLKKMEK